jgi:hypothetical protein
VTLSVSTFARCPRPTPSPSPTLHHDWSSPTLWHCRLRLDLCVSTAANATTTSSPFYVTPPSHPHGHMNRRDLVPHRDIEPRRRDTTDWQRGSPLSDDTLDRVDQRHHDLGPLPNDCGDSSASRARNQDLPSRLPTRQRSPPHSRRPPLREPCSADLDHRSSQPTADKAYRVGAMEEDAPPRVHGSLSQGPPRNTTGKVQAADRTLRPPPTVSNRSGDSPRMLVGNTVQNPQGNSGTKSLESRLVRLPDTSALSPRGGPGPPSDLRSQLSRKRKAQEPDKSIASDTGSPPTAASGRDAVPSLDPPLRPERKAIPPTPEDMARSMQTDSSGNAAVEDARPSGHDPRTKYVGVSPTNFSFLYQCGFE